MDKESLQVTKTQVQWQTYNLCIFAALSELLHSIGMFYIIHWDGIYHDHAIILSEAIQRKQINQKHF